MTTPRRPPAQPPRPVAFGCFGALLAVVLAVAFIAFTLVFLDSGANRGELTLEHRDAYAAGSLEYVAERNFYLVRLANGDYYALSDLDAANRAADGRRCRAAPLAATDPDLPGLIERYRGRFSPAASGTTVILQETCNGALYDITGLRLDDDARNLDRYPVSFTDAGRVVVDVSNPVCTRRTATTLFQEVRCAAE